MRKVTVFFKEEEAGTLTKNENGSFVFRYTDAWLTDDTKPSISLSLPKKTQTYMSDHLFPFFYNMLPEGTNKELVCSMNRLDKNDDFGLLIATATHDNIGAVRVAKTTSK